MGSKEGWGGYENRVYNIDDVEPHEGVFCGRLRGGFSSAFDQRVTLEANMTYRVSVHSRWSENPGQDVSVGAVVEETNSENRTAASLPNDTVWRETTFTVTPTQTQEYVFWIWTGEAINAHLYLDTISIRLEDGNQ